MIVQLIYYTHTPRASDVYGQKKKSIETRKTMGNIDLSDNCGNFYREMPGRKGSLVAPVSGEESCCG